MKPPALHGHGATSRLARLYGELLGLKYGDTQPLFNFKLLDSIYEALVKRIHIVSTNFEPGIFLLWQCLSIATEFGYKAHPVHTVHSHIYHL